MSLFSAISPEDMQAARIVTGVTMAAFIGVGFAPGLRPYARTIRLWLLLLFLLACAGLLARILMRQDYSTTASAMRFTPLSAIAMLPSRVTIMLRTTPPPDGIVQVWNVSVAGSKRTSVLGRTPDSLYRSVRFR